MLSAPLHRPQRIAFVILLVLTTALISILHRFIGHHQESRVTNGSPPVTVSSSCRFPDGSWSKNNVYVLTMKSRESTVKKTLEPVFPCLQMVDGVPKEQIFLWPESPVMLAEPTAWDFADRRILKTAYKQSRYPQPGVIACTLGHRRILERFVRQHEGQQELHDDQPVQHHADHQETAVALILEDDAKPHVFANKSNNSEVTDILVEIIDNMKGLDWDFIQLGRCYDMFCDDEKKKDRQSVDFPVAVLGYHHHIIRIHKSNGFELCSHAYLVSKRGAEKILQYSLPILLPYVSF
jgi:hypothetical protein